MGFGGKGAFVYAPGDAGSQNKREPSRDFVPSSWTVSAQKAAQTSAVGLTALIAIGTIWLLSRGRK